jgi:hypothetical protein
VYSIVSTAPSASRTTTCASAGSPFMVTVTVTDSSTTGVALDGDAGISPFTGVVGTQATATATRTSTTARCTPLLPNPAIARRTADGVIVLYMMSISQYLLFRKDWNGRPRSSVR